MGFTMFVYSQHAVEAAWLVTEDLLQAHQPIEARHTALLFLTALLNSQVKKHNVDFTICLAGYQTITDLYSGWSA